MILLSELTDYLQQLLRPELCKDYCPNGLQVSGRSEIKKIVTGVTASLALLHAAVAANADTILVHHGYFWQNENPCVVGVKYRRLQCLIQNNISLLAYHLPLDVHKDFGNNIQLAKKLNFNITGEIKVGVNSGLVLQGILSQEYFAEDFVKYLHDNLGFKPLHLSAGINSKIKKIAWCTGAAQDFIEAAAMAGCDAFLSGEVSERTMHQALELGIHYFACGHHATERFGVQALGANLAQQFNIQHEFIDIPNPV